ncbi:MAG: C39 family peptidase [Planctomycetota bacterium]
MIFLTGCCWSDTSGRNAIALSDEAVVLDVRFESQKEENLCGTSSITMLMNYWQVSGTPEKEKHLAAQAATGDGLTGEAAADYLEECGFNVFLFNGELSGNSKRGVFYHINKGRPVIVLISSGEKRHYLLMVGYDPIMCRVVYIDPIAGHKALPYRRFEEMWEPCENFSLLAVPK